MQLLSQVAARDDELAGKDEQLSASLREAAEINEQYIADLSSGQQQLEAEVASLTAQLEAATEAAAQRAQQEADMHTAHKRLRGQVVCPGPLADPSILCQTSAQIVDSLADKEKRSV